jgi:hypothetical protein
VKTKELERKNQIPGMLAPADAFIRQQQQQQQMFQQQL